jgi:hypothetical protein
MPFGGCGHFESTGELVKWWYPISLNATKLPSLSSSTQNWGWTCSNCTGAQRQINIKVGKA